MLNACEGLFLKAVLGAAASTGGTKAAGGSGWCSSGRAALAR